MSIVQVYIDPNLFSNQKSQATFQKATRLYVLKQSASPLTFPPDGRCLALNYSNKINYYLYIQRSYSALL